MFYNLNSRRGKWYLMFRVFRRIIPISDGGVIIDAQGVGVSFEKLGHKTVIKN